MTTVSVFATEDFEEEIPIGYFEGEELYILPDNGIEMFADFDVYKVKYSYYKNSTYPENWSDSGSFTFSNFYPTKYKVRITLPKELERGTKYDFKLRLNVTGLSNATFDYLEATDLNWWNKTIINDINQFTFFKWYIFLTLKIYHLIVQLNILMFILLVIRHLLHHLLL